MAIDIKRGLTKAETVALASLPGLPDAALAILAAASEPAGKAAPMVLGPERGVWFRATAAAFERAQAAGVDLRWGRCQVKVKVKVPPAWTVYRDKQGRVRAGNVIQQVPEPAFFPGRAIPAGAVILGPAGG